ncbi:hypothetical protein AGMMS50276_26090 [Synergistales bacterium]|nr:hypothetical protein AGMMS50276_26090 [Synergistales bacterium]
MAIPIKSSRIAIKKTVIQLSKRNMDTADSPIAEKASLVMVPIEAAAKSVINKNLNGIGVADVKNNGKMNIIPTKRRLMRQYTIKNWAGISSPFINPSAT